MRRVFEQGYQLKNKSAHGVVLEKDNAQIQVEFLTEKIAHFYRKEATQKVMDNTFSVVNQVGEGPAGGQLRDQLDWPSRPHVKVEEFDKGVRLASSEMSFHLDLQNLIGEWKSPQTEVFATDLKTGAYASDPEGKTLWHYMVRDPQEMYFGLGEKSGVLNKAERRWRFMNTDAMGYDAELTDPLYKHIPFVIVYNPKTQVSYGVFYDNLSESVLDLGTEVHAYHGPYRYWQAADGALDYYMIYGPTIKDVVRQFIQLTGKMILPPQWTLGYLGSTMSYTDSDNAQEELKDFGVQCEKHDIPCDLFHLSSGYTSMGDKRYVFHWNREKIPDPQQMVDDFHAKGMKLSANVKPYLLNEHPRYEEAREQGLFVQQRANDMPEVSYFWGDHGSLLDFTNPKTVKWWQENLKDQLFKYGIDSIWNDNNEYYSDDDEARCHGFGRGLNLGQLRPLMSFLMTRASFEAQKDFFQVQNPFLISRSGCAGLQRYAQTWTGDNFTSWKSLKYNIPMGLGLGLSGIANYGHDIGGFAGGKPDPELFVRWVQCGIYNPRFCIHSWNDDQTVNEPWMYPEVLPVIRDTIKWRYKLIPFLYTLFEESHRTGDPINRPLFYDYEQDPKAFERDFEFMLGRDVLVAPVFEPGARSRQVYLPKDERPESWVHWQTQKVYASGEEVEVPAPLEECPIFVREGARDITQY